MSDINKAIGGIIGIVYILFADKMPPLGINEALGLLLFWGYIYSA